MRHGCLIVALGSPAEPTPREIRRFLKPFLSDRRVVDFHPAIWWPVLHGIVLPFRPSRIAEQYESVWLPEGSPLTVHTIAQREHLANELPDVDVRYAMTYTSPSIPEALAEMDVDHLTILPLFPQYAPSTVAAVVDQVMDVYRNATAMPNLTIVSSWEEAPLYIEWQAEQLRTALAESPVDRVVFSYHGVPERPRHAPREYVAQCEATSRAIMARVGDVPFENTYQSKFGPGEWLSPATIDRMAEYPADGVQRIAMMTPGFFADCIETLEELDILNQQTFLEAGGESYVRVAPPNSDPITGPMLAEVYRMFAPSGAPADAPTGAPADSSVTHQ